MASKIPLMKNDVGRSMQIRVLREACCAQDDQAGPLDATYEVLPETSFGQLVTAIVESRFLQYSASHVVLQGEVSERPVVRVFSPYHVDVRQPEFLVMVDQPAIDVTGTQALLFRFVFE